jgi:hypothetical protein
LYCQYTRYTVVQTSVYSIPWYMLQYVQYSCYNIKKLIIIYNNCMIYKYEYWNNYVHIGRAGVKGPIYY